MILGKISSYTTLELALMTLLGYLGNGSDRKTILGDRFNDVQNIVNLILRTNKVPVGSLEEFRQVLLEEQPTDEEYQEFVNDIVNKL